MRERIAKLTKRTVDAAEPEAERYILWDSALKGFGLRVETSGTKTFLVRYRIAGRKRFVALGRFGQLTPEQARGLAQETLANVRHGHDPAAERRKERAANSVAELASRFLAEHVGAKRKSSTAVHYRGLVECHLLPKHGSRKAHDFARADLSRLHLSLQDRPYQANCLLSVVASMYSFGERHGLVPKGYNPAARIERFPKPAARTLPVHGRSWPGSEKPFANLRATDGSERELRHCVCSSSRAHVSGKSSICAGKMSILSAGCCFCPTPRRVEKPSR